MTFGSGLGMEVGLRRVPGARRFRRDDFLLFSESNSRFVCTVPPALLSEFERAMTRAVHAPIGRVRTGLEMRIDGLQRTGIVRLGVGEATAAWRHALGRKL